jgi:hypothetical protein
VAAVIALVSANEAMLATLVAATVVLWAMSTIRHAVTAVATKADVEAPRDLMQKAA